jgi:hypothetical protein
MLRSSRRLGLVLLALSGVAGPARAQDGAQDRYPTIPDDQDYLCETIGRSPAASVPPGDRTWFRENCTCTEARLCGRAGSKRYAARLKAGTGDSKVQKEAAAKVDAWRRSALQSTDRLRQEYRACRATSSGTACQSQMTALEEGCQLVGLLTWDECLARE